MFTIYVVCLHVPYTRLSRSKPGVGGGPSGQLHALKLLLQLNVSSIHVCVASNHIHSQLPSQGSLDPDPLDPDPLGSLDPDPLDPDPLDPSLDPLDPDPLDPSLEPLDPLDDTLELLEDGQRQPPQGNQPMVSIPYPLG